MYHLQLVTDNWRPFITLYQHPFFKNHGSLSFPHVPVPLLFPFIIYHVLLSFSFSLIVSARPQFIRLSWHPPPDAHRGPGTRRRRQEPITSSSRGLASLPQDTASRTWVSRCPWPRLAPGRAARTARSRGVSVAAGESRTSTRPAAAPDDPPLPTPNSRPERSRESQLFGRARLLRRSAGLTRIPRGGPHAICGVRSHTLFLYSYYIHTMWRIRYALLYYMVALSKQGITQRSYIDFCTCTRT